MATFKLINIADAKRRMEHEKIQLVDIRDGDSYLRDHLDGAYHLNNTSVTTFMKKVDVNTPVFVICYHGNSSKGVAQYLCDQGYVDVYSVEGGMVEWVLSDSLD